MQSVIWQKTIVTALAAGSFFFVMTQSALAQESSVFPALVISTDVAQSGIVEGFEIATFSQNVTLEVKTSEGIKRVEMLNDFTPLTAGDRIYVRQEVDDTETFYTIYDINRTPAIAIIGGLFVLVVLIFGGWYGARSLLSLTASIGIIFYILMPIVASGRSPITWGIGIAICLLAVVMGVTHGLRPKTYAAFLGTSIAILLTGIVAFVAVRLAQFSGLGTEAAFFLSVAATPINMTDLLLAGIIIGMLGVLDDVAITQAAVVMELKRAGVRGRDLYTRAMVVGREHVGALINTLVLAYAGAALPLFLLLSTYDEPLGALMSIEIVATEIMRALVGSIGLIMAVPITTLLATRFSARDDRDVESPCAHGHH